MLEKAAISRSKSNQAKTVAALVEIPVDVGAEVGIFGAMWEVVVKNGVYAPNWILLSNT